MKYLSYKNIALPLRNDSISRTPVSLSRPSHRASELGQLLSGILSLVFANRIFSPLLVLAACLFCISCGSTDTDRVDSSDTGYYAGDTDNGGDSVNDTNPDAGTGEDGGIGDNPDITEIDGGTEPDGGAEADSGGTETGGIPPATLPVGFEPADGADCVLPGNINTTGTVSLTAEPYIDPTPNPDGENCFLKISQMASDGTITIEFPEAEDISGNYITFDVMHKDAKLLNSAIMFLLLFDDEDDSYANVSNTTEMTPDVWYRVSLSIAQFMDRDQASGNGTLDQTNIRRLKIQPFNSSVGMGPMDQISELAFDNFVISDDDQTGPIVTE